MQSKFRRLACVVTTFAALGSPNLSVQNRFLFSLTSIAEAAPAATQTATVIPNVNVMISYAAALDARCNLTEVGSWTVRTPPTLGVVSSAVSTVAYPGVPCNGRTTPVAGLYFTWTNADPTQIQDTFVARWATASNSYDVTFTVNKGSSIPNVLSTLPVPKTLGGATSEVNRVSTLAGNPIDYATGNKYEAATDYVGGGPFPLALQRFYNSLGTSSLQIFGGWSGSYSRRITARSGTVVEMIRDDERVFIFFKTGAVWKSDADVAGTLTQTATGWNYRNANDEIETYAANGRLVRITNRAGLAQTVGYDAQGRLSSVMDPFGRALNFTYASTTSRVISEAQFPDGRKFTYAYDARYNLTSVRHPDTGVIGYVYGNAQFPRFLTRIMDESGQPYADFAYDAAGRAVLSTHPSSQRYEVDYSARSSGLITVTNPGRAKFKYALGVVGGQPKPFITTVACETCEGSPPSAQDRMFLDAQGNVTRRINLKGQVTDYRYDLVRNLEVFRAEAVGTTEARVIRTAWHPTFRLPTQITEPNRVTTFSYDARGNMLSKRVQSGVLTRTFTYTYNSSGQLLTARDPRGNATTYSYDANGNLATITNALGHVTTLRAYDANGRPGVITDPNGRDTLLTYNFRGQITRYSEGAPPAGLSHVHLYTYDLAGLLTRSAFPDGSRLDFTYDNQRVVRVTDGNNNRIDYSLNSFDTWAAQNVYDSAGMVVRSFLRYHDALGRLRIEASLAGSPSPLAAQFFFNDYLGNVVATADGERNTTLYSYDGLNRIRQELSPLSERTFFSHDANDNLTAAFDRRGLKTTYVWDGLGNETALTSPDTGLTTRTFDAAGNVLTSRDARGNTTAYDYDALNRRIRAVFADGSSTVWVYDQGPNGKGRLKSVTDFVGSSVKGSTTYAYDIHGHVTSKRLAVGTMVRSISYIYDYNSGNLTSAVYPSGMRVNYAYDLQGRLTALTRSDGQVFIRDVRYTPFGGVAGWVFGNSEAYARNFDLSGRIYSITMPANASLFLAYDAASHVVASSDYVYFPGVHARSFNYDPDGRLMNYSRYTTGGTNWLVSFGYDPNGNRTSKFVQTPTSTQLFSYLYATNSNRLQNVSGAQSETFTYDPTGNTTADSGASANYTFTYDARNRLVRSTTGGLAQDYIVNGLGQRVGKSDPANASRKTYFFYDEAGHLLGEYSASGAAVQETVWLGDLPIATVQPLGVFFIAPDHLGAPHQITNVSRQRVWAWSPELFGDNLIVTSLTYNLRFPGQYYDAETGLHYNYYRDYNPRLGRYMQSDPIGLAGGINTYSYANNDPASLADPTGQCPWCYGAITGAVGAYITMKPDSTIAERVVGIAAGAVAGAAVSAFFPNAASTSAGAAAASFASSILGQTIGAYGTGGDWKDIKLGAAFGAAIGGAIGGPLNEGIKHTFMIPLPVIGRSVGSPGFSSWEVGTLGAQIEGVIGGVSEWALQDAFNGSANPQGNASSSAAETKKKKEDNELNRSGGPDHTCSGPGACAVR